MTRTAASNRHIISNYGKSLAFDGATNGVTLTGFKVSTTAFSILFTAKIRNFVNNDRILDQQDSGPANGLTMVVASATNQIGFGLRNVGTSVALINSKSLNKGQWYRFIATYEPNSAKFYVDGSLQGTDTACTMTDSTAVLTIGKRIGGSNFANMVMKDFVVLNRVITTAEISDYTFNRKIPTSPQVLLDMNENITDTSGNGVNGTAVGTPIYLTDVPKTLRSVASNRSILKQNYEILPGTLFEGFESTTGWTTSPNAPEKLILETSDIKEGSGAIKLVSSSSSNNQMAIKTISKLFTDRDGYLSFYVKPSTNVDSIVLGFTSTTSFASVYMGYTLSTTNMFVNKWNFVRIKLSNFTATGGDSFANLMIRMRIRVVSSNASEATAIFDNLRYGTWSRPKIILQSDNAASLSIINTMYPILTTAGMKATLYVQSNVIGVANKLTLANLQTLYAAGWDLGNHTNGHENLTTATISEAQTTVETCETFLRDNGFYRALGHIAYPEGATDDTVNAMLSGIGFKTGRKATDKPQIVPMADPYKLEAYTLKAADSLATMKSYVDAAINGGKTSIIMIEGLADSSPAAQEILTSDYQALVDYIKAYKDQGVLDVVTISEWYNGLDGIRTGV